MLIHQVLHQDPPRPRQVDPRVPRDLETIVLKAMAREPSRRYATAAELAEDLRRFLDDRPIRARRVSTAERAWRWSKRNPWLAGALGSTAAALVVVAGLAILYAGQKARLAEQQTRIANEQTKARVQIDRLNSELTERGHDLEKSLAKASLNLAMLHFERGREACEKGEIGTGLLRLTECWRSAIAADGLGTGWRHIARTSLSAWQRRHPELKAVLLPFGSDHKCRLQPRRQGRAHREHGQDGTAVGRSDGPAARARPDPSGPVLAAAFSPDGRAVIIGSMDETARLWDAATGRPIGPTLTHKGRVSAVAFSPDGKAVLTGGWDGMGRLWDAATGRPLEPTLTHQGPVTAVAFGPAARP